MVQVGFVPLHRAAVTGSCKVASLLLSYNADPTIRAIQVSFSLSLSLSHGSNDDLLPSNKYQISNARS
jgi:hypothetical protein